MHLIHCASCHHVGLAISNLGNQINVCPLIKAIDLFSICPSFSIAYLEMNQ